MVQWVKSPTAVARVAVEAQVRSPAWYSQLKEAALPQLQLGFNPWLGNVHVPQVRPRKKTQNPTPPTNTCVHMKNAYVHTPSIKYVYGQICTRTHPAVLTYTLHVCTCTRAFSPTALVCIFSHVCIYHLHTSAPRRGPALPSPRRTLLFSSSCRRDSASCSSSSSSTSFSVSTWYMKLVFSLSSCALETMAFLYFSSASARESCRGQATVLELRKETKPRRR